MGILLPSLSRVDIIFFHMEVPMPQAIELIERFLGLWSELVPKVWIFHASNLQSISFYIAGGTRAATKIRDLKFRVLSEISATIGIRL
jgi:hypothetical protein